MKEMKLTGHHAARISILGAVATALTTGIAIVVGYGAPFSFSAYLFCWAGLTTVFCFMAAYAALMRAEGTDQAALAYIVVAGCCGAISGGILGLIGYDVGRGRFLLALFNLGSMAGLTAGGATASLPAFLRAHRLAQSGHVSGIGETAVVGGRWIMIVCGALVAANGVLSCLRAQWEPWRGFSFLVLALVGAVGLVAAFVGRWHKKKTNLQSIVG